MNENSNIKYVDPNGIVYTNEESCRRTWDNYNNIHVHIGPNGEQYKHSKECEKAWERYYNNKSSTKRGR